MEQLSLFDLDKMVETIQSEPGTAPALIVSAPVTSAANVKKVKPEITVKPILSESVLKQLNDIKSLYDICQFAATDTCYLSYRNTLATKDPGYRVSVDGAVRVDIKYRNQIPLMDEMNSIHIRVNKSYNHYDDKQTMVYFDKDGNAWGRTCRLDYTGDGSYRSEPLVWNITTRWESAKWRLLTSLPADGIIFVQTPQFRKQLFQEKMPYTFKFYKEQEHRFSMDLLMLCPQIELLDKAGYAFVDQVRFYPGYIDSEITTSFNRLIKFEKNPGKLQNVFKTTKEVCKILKDERKLSVWDQIRRLEKFSKSSPDEIQVIYDNHYGDKELANLQNILKQQYHNKNVFTFTSLVNYLNRLDQYEAIGATEALQLLKDYLESCRLLDMEPRIDGDSLKREHDVAARLVRERRNEIEAKRMVEGCKRLQQYNYENDKFIIRGVRNYDDLLDEAKQQHNCVASYSSKIASGTSLIFVMRRKTVPNRSFVTIELSPDLSTVRQKYEAHNQPLRNKEASDFIDEWQKHCKAVKKGLVEPHILESDKSHMDLVPVVSGNDVEDEDISI